MREFAIVYRVDGMFDISLYPADAQGQYRLLLKGTGNSTYSRVPCNVAGVETDMWVNEDFISLELPLNDVATVCHSMMVGPENAYICGDVVFTGPTDKRGFTRGLYAEEAAEVLQELIMLEEMITKSRLHHAREARESGAHAGKHPV